jgi:hypothetical protein
MASLIAQNELSVFSIRDVPGFSDELGKLVSK